MSKRKVCYKISEKGGIWTAKGFNSNTDEVYPFEMFCERVEHLEQIERALMTTKENGKHDLYLPIMKAESTYVDQKCLPVLTDIESYEYFNGTFLLRMNDYCTFIQPYTYAQYLSGDGIVEGRRENLPKIYCKNSYIRKEFGYLNGNSIIFRADGKDYFIPETYCYPRDTDTHIEIIPVGIAEPLPGNNDCFKVHTSEGEYIREGFFSGDYNFQLYHKVEPFEDKDYPIIFPKKSGYYGYWFKDLNGNILKMSIYPTNKQRVNYTIVPESPAKSINFITKHVSTEKGSSVEIWKIVQSNGEEKFALKFNYNSLDFTIRDCIITDKKDFM